MDETEVRNIIMRAKQEQATTLDLSKKGLVSVPAELARLIDLEQLRLDGNQLSALPPELAQLTKLASLDLDGNQLTAIPPGLAQLTNLTYLYLARNQLRTIPRELAQLTNLRILWLHKNQLSAIPPELAQLTNLEQLRLDDNQLSAIPPGLAQLTKLARLDLGGNQLSVIPPGLTQLTNLTTLTLNNNQLRAIPPELARLTNLEQLRLDGNQLSTIPPELAQLTKLAHLDLDSNQFSVIPPELARLSNLRTLWLNDNRLSAIPPELPELTSLEKLHLAVNHLSAISPELARLTNLTYLDLGYNQLSAIPPELAQLTKLEEFSLAGNQLSALPPELARLTNLKGLDLSRNQLSAIPPELAQLTNLERLRLEGNPLESPPPEVVEEGSGAILAYLRELAKGARKRYEAKLLILGHGKEGKTCVSRALREEPFKENIRTEGVEVARWTFAHPEHADDDGKRITLNVWDFEGQEINHQSHQFFLTANALYLLVINGRRAFELERAEYWLDTIRARAPQSRVILVASECENTTPSWPLDKLKAAYGDLLEGQKWYFVVGCQSGKGVDELAREIQAAAAKMKIMGADWPETYEEAERRIRERAEAEPSIRRTELNDLLGAAGISKNNVESAIDRFATLGLMTQFRESTELADFVVLNPQWLTKGISQVMEDSQLDDDKGEITHERMRSIWDTKGYRGLYPMLHNCMREFELCYDMEDMAGCLVPLRFGDARPEIPWSSIAGAKARRIEYKLNITAPKGIMSRLIVKTHHMIVKTQRSPKGVYWQNGVFLRTGEGDYASEAVCEFDPGERTVRIEVRAAFPQSMIEQLHGFAKAVFQFFDGLKPDRRYGCVKFEPREEQCPGVHPEKRILFAISRGKGEIDCEQGWHVVDPRKLVYGFPSFGQAALTVEVLRHELDQRPAWAKDVIQDLAQCLVWIDKTHTETLKLREGQERIPAEMKQQIEMGMREYLHLLDEMLDNRDFASAPGVIAIVPIDGSAFNPKTWFNQRYELRPYCEADSGVHPVDFRLPLTKPRVWWEKTAPYLALGVKVLSAGLSIGFAGMPLAVGDELYKSVKNEVTFMKELTKHLELEGRAASDVSKAAGSFVEKMQRARGHMEWTDLRQEDQKRVAREQLSELLRELAPANYGARQWGPLRRIHMPDNTHRWLCEEHAEQRRK